MTTQEQHEVIETHRDLGPLAFNTLVSDVLHLLQRKAVGAEIMIYEVREGDFPGQIEVLHRDGDWYTVTIKGV